MSQLNILVKALLDPAQTQKDIQAQLDQLKDTKINIKLNIDGDLNNIVKNVESLTKAIGNMQSALEDLNISKSIGGNAGEIDLGGKKLIEQLQEVKTQVKEYQNLRQQLVNENKSFNESQQGMLFNALNAGAIRAPGKKNPLYDYFMQLPKSMRQMFQSATDQTKMELGQVAKSLNMSVAEIFAQLGNGIPKIDFKNQLSQIDIAIEELEARKMTLERMLGGKEFSDLKDELDQMDLASTTRFKDGNGQLKGTQYNYKDDSGNSRIVNVSPEGIVTSEKEKDDLEKEKKIQEQRQKLLDSIDASITKFNGKKQKIDISYLTEDNGGVQKLKEAEQLLNEIETKSKNGQNTKNDQAKLNQMYSDLAKLSSNTQTLVSNIVKLQNAFEKLDQENPVVAQSFNGLQERILSFAEALNTINPNSNMKDLGDIYSQLSKDINAVGKEAQLSANQMQYFDGWLVKAQSRFNKIDPSQLNQSNGGAEQYQNLSNMLNEAGQNGHATQKQMAEIDVMTQSIMKLSKSYLDVSLKAENLNNVLSGLDQKSPIIAKEFGDLSSRAEELNKSFSTINTDTYENDIKKLDLQYKELLNDIQTVVEESKRVKGLGDLKTSGLNINFSDKDQVKQAISDQYGDLHNSRITRVVQDDGTQVYKYSVQIKELGGSLKTFKGSVDETTKALYEQGNAIDNNHTFLNKFEQHMVNSMQYMAIWGGYNKIVQASSEAFIQLPKAMAGVQQVLPQLHDNQEALNKATSDFIGISERYGQSIFEVLDGAKLWGRQYKDLNTVMTLTNATTLLSVVDNLELSDANKALEASMSQFGKTAKDSSQAFQYSMEIVDSWSNLAHNAMVSTQDLALGMEKTGSVANMMGVSFDEMNALIATSVRDTGMSGQNLGNMWKSVNINAA